MNEHKKLFPLCGFVRGLPMGNVEIGEEGLEDEAGEVLEGIEEGVEVGEEAAGTGQEGSRRSPGQDEAGSIVDKYYITFYFLNIRQKYSHIY